MKQINKKLLENPKQHIPKGAYCYDNNGDCSFWDMDESKPHQENGYCHYLKKGDWDINSEGGIIVDMKTRLLSVWWIIVESSKRVQS